MISIFGIPAAGPLAKICGLRRVEDLVAARDAGADLVGLVFAPSRRRLEPEAAGLLLASVPDHPPALGVFVDATVDWMEAVAAQVGLRYFQLSGDEDPAEASRLSLPYLKAIQLRPGDDAASTLHIMTRHRGAVGFVLDSPSAQGGGSGQLADWALAGEVIRRAGRPVLLAGGLDPGNVAAGLLTTGAAGADVSSGVEVDGWKDAALIAYFVAAVRDQRPVAVAYTGGSGMERDNR